MENEKSLLDFMPTDTSGDKTSTGATEVCIRGEVLRVVFSNEDESYTVIRLIDDNGNEKTLVGPLKGIVEGQRIEATGRWHTHKVHGAQFRVDNFRAILPTSKEGIKRYLASGILPGVGEKLAERIVNHFGTDTLDVLDNYSKRLEEIPGLGAKKIEKIVSSWQDSQEQRETYIYLQGLGLSATYCNRLMQKFGAGAAEIVRKNPYRLAEEIHGIGFESADKVAGKAGFSKEDPVRLSSGIVYTLSRLAEDGHTCYPRETLKKEAARTLDVPIEQAEEGLVNAQRDGQICSISYGKPEKQTYIYTKELYQTEKSLAAKIATLLATSSSSEGKELKPQKVSNYEMLNEEQRQAYQRAFESQISVVTGGPGVGKTTVVGRIVEGAKKNRCKLFLAAPTGRAAKRLSESCGMEASTIHRMLKWDPHKRRFVYNEDRPLPCDFLIIDEVSMIDVYLAYHLFSAIRQNTHIVLVGDKDQLPSVGPGSVLRNLIDSQRIPVTELTQIYRQGRGSRITLNAHALNAGRMPDLASPPDNETSDFYWVEQDAPENAAQLIAKMVAERVPQAFGFTATDDIQVLTPMNRGACGATQLNQLLQHYLNGSSQNVYQGNYRTFKEKDRVMQTVNNYDKEVFNGELGRITGLGPDNECFYVNFAGGNVAYDRLEADQLRLAYATTVHKSQGNEFPVVILPVLTQHYVMLQRNLIYTAMTRARKLLVMIGTKKALGIALRNNKPTQRCTLFVQWLRKYTDQ